MTATSIEWTQETWNPVTGCTRASVGCDHCYAVAKSHRLGSIAKTRAKYGGLTVLNDNGDRHFNGTVRTHADALSLPLRWRKPRRVFVNSMSDLFHRDVPFEFIDRVFAVMNATHIFPPKKGDEKAKPWHTYQVLTKRPERMAEYLASRDPKRYEQGDWPIFRVRGDVFRGMGRAIMNAAGVGLWPLPNVWLGTSVEDQAAADERIPQLLKCPAAVRFLSCEPLLGELDISNWINCYWSHEGESDYEIPPRSWVPGDGWQDHDGSWVLGGQNIDWLILGGESGPGARPCDVAWLRSLVEQGKAADVPVFVKQLGANVVSSFDEWNDGTRTDGRLDGDVMHWQLADRKGGYPEEWPDDLRVREFPLPAEVSP